MLNILLALKDPPEEITGILKAFNTDTLHTNSSLYKSLKDSNYDIAIIDGDIEKIEPIKTFDPRVDIILFGSDASLALEAIHRGATAYFTPTLDVSAFRDTIGRIEKVNRLRRETFELENNLSDKYMFEERVVRPQKGSLYRSI